jgi:NADH-ubiquinone oxidoreductase chain 4L
MLVVTSLICSQVLIFTGLYGFFFRRDNLILTMILLEISLLGVALLFAVTALLFSDFAGLITFFMLLTLAGVESALGLALVISYYRARTSIR